MSVISLKRLGGSMRDAGRGLYYTFKTEQNFRVQTLLAIVALMLAAYFPLRTWETILIILLIVMVMTMELLNTAVEKFADLLIPRLHHYISTIKDVMAAAVLLTSIGAGVIGIMIFLPHFINFLN